MAQLSVEFINPFAMGAYSVLQMVLGENPTKGPVAAQPACFTSEQVNVVIGVTGDAVGTVILGMSLATADKIASTMIGMPVKSFDQLAASAIAELGNMISGNALQAISESGSICDIAPPTVIRGAQVNISTVALPAVIVPLNVSQGTISLTLSLQSKVAKAA